MLTVDGLRWRSLFLQALRSFFFEQGFLEVDTPIRHLVSIPERHIEPLRCGDTFLQTSPELAMKMLLARGCQNIFQICHCFRKNEQGQRHLEEFTMLEWYRRDSDYNALMDDCQDLLNHLFQRLKKEYTVEQSSLFSGVDLFPPWPRISVHEAFARFCPVSLDAALKEDLFDALLVHHVEPQLGKAQPCFLVDYPASLASLARKKTQRPELAERFELYISGVEIANGFSELTDADEQRQRFHEEIASIREQRGETFSMPDRFLNALPGIGTAAGIALGVDRLFMLCFGIEDIAQAVSFTSEEL